jgi:hypothetical protein
VIITCGLDSNNKGVITNFALFQPCISSGNCLSN